MLFDKRSFEKFTHQIKISRKKLLWNIKLDPKYVTIKRSWFKGSVTSYNNILNVLF